MKKDPPQKIVHNIPKHNGFGSEEDSLLSVFQLRPRNSIKQVTEMFKRDKHILRYIGKMVSQFSADMERTFVFSYYVKDSTLQIYEEADKNSGRTSARFMERRKVINPNTGKYYTDKEFYIGATIYINKYIFKLVTCDDYTKHYMRDNCEDFHDSNIDKIIRRIQKESAAYKSNEEFLIQLIAYIDPNNKEFVSGNEIVEGLKG